MQKRHYEAIADILKDVKHTIYDEYEYKELCVHFAFGLSQRNENFKLNTFLKHIFGEE